MRRPPTEPVVLPQRSVDVLTRLLPIEPVVFARLRDAVIAAVLMLIRMIPTSVWGMNETVRIRGTGPNRDTTNRPPTSPHASNNHTNHPPFRLASPAHPQAVARHRGRGAARTVDATKARHPCRAFDRVDWMTRCVGIRLAGATGCSAGSGWPAPTSPCRPAGAPGSW